MRLAPKILWTTPIYHSSRLSVSINTVFIANGRTLCKSNRVGKMLSGVKIKIVWQTLRRRPRHCLSAVLSIFVKTKMATPSTEYDQQRQARYTPLFPSRTCNKDGWPTCCLQPDWTDLWCHAQRRNVLRNYTFMMACKLVLITLIYDRFIHKVVGWKCRPYRRLIIV